jgi:putative endonuclease
MKRPCVYIMASSRNATLCVGVTSDLARRVNAHRTGAIKAFRKRYGCKLLVWLEPHERMDQAIVREKQIKSGSRVAAPRLLAMTIGRRHRKAP